MTSAVVVGRFQCPFLHQGHLHLLNTASNLTDKLVVVIGCANVSDDRNPFRYEWREELIKNAFPNALILRIDDKPTDEEWSKDLDDLLEGLEHPILFGSRDSFISRYKGSIEYQPVTEIIGMNATNIRNLVKHGFLTTDYE